RGIHRSVVIYFEMQADDVSLSPCQCQELFAASTHEDRRMGTLIWFRESWQIGHSVMGPCKSNGFLGEELFDDVQGLFQAVDTYPCPVKGEIDLFVFRSVPACSNAQFKAPFG